MQELFVTNSGVAFQLDDEDHAYVSQWEWQLHSSGYATRTAGGVTILLHRLIAGRIGLCLKYDIDHKDRNKFNNRRDNLRAATRSQTLANTNSRSGYKGVDWNVERQLWRARVRMSGHTYNLGRFLCERAAARAYNSAARKVHGEFAVLNLDVDCGQECSICCKLIT